MIFEKYIVYSILDNNRIEEILDLYFIVKKIKESRIYYDNKNDIGHYTRMSNIKFLIKVENDARLRLNNVAYMNDPNEGNIFWSLLKKSGKDVDNIIEVLCGQNEFNGRKIINGDSHTYLSSFSYAIDNLPMWVQYSENGQGCCLIFNNEIFDMEEYDTLQYFINTKLEKSEVNKKSTDNEMIDKDEKSYCLYKVMYIDEEKYNDTNNDAYFELKKTIDEIIDKLIIIKKEIILDDKIRTIVANILDQIRFLFKSVDYQHEKELRIIRFQMDNVKLSSTSENYNVPHLFIELDRELKYKEVILGPKVEYPQEIATYLKYTNKVRNVTLSKIEYK